MTSERIWLEVLERISAQGGAKIFITEQELCGWPNDVVSAMKTCRLITKAPPAASTVCSGCERECIMPVDVLIDHAQASHAFITCDKRQDINRVSVAISCLEQWQTSGGEIANLVASLLDLESYGVSQPHVSKWEIGLLRGAKHASYLTILIEEKLKLSLAGHIIALTDVLSFVSSTFQIDRRRLNDLVDHPIAGAGDKETAQQRRERLQKQVNQLKAQKVKAFLKITAKEEDISVSRLKQILAD